MRVFLLEEMNNGIWTLYQVREARAAVGDIKATDLVELATISRLDSETPAMWVASNDKNSFHETAGSCIADALDGALSTACAHDGCDCIAYEEAGD